MRTRSTGGRYAPTTRGLHLVHVQKSGNPRASGPGVMIYWHVEGKSVCIYSQLKSCSASEVASMIEGVLRHCTDMVVDRQYTDTHGASIVGFAFAHMLDFKLMPRLKNIGSAKLYRPAAGEDDNWPNLASVLSTKTIDWDLIAHDQIVKYTTALRLGTAEAEQVLRRVHQGRAEASYIPGDRGVGPGGAYLVRLRLPRRRKMRRPQLPAGRPEAQARDLHV